MLIFQGYLLPGLFFLDFFNHFHTGASGALACGAVRI
jgi:hypothetical protein